MPVQFALLGLVLLVAPQTSRILDPVSGQSEAHTRRHPPSKGYAGESNIARFGLDDLDRIVSFLRKHQDTTRRIEYG